MCVVTWYTPIAQFVILSKQGTPHSEMEVYRYYTILASLTSDEELFA